MRKLEVSLIEWPEGPYGGPTLIGRTADPCVVSYVRDRIASERHADLSRLTGDDDDPHADAPMTDEGGK